jgi:Fe-S-cluster containining protein
MPKDPQFICEKCGECCRHIDHVPDLEDIQTNGVCNHLSGDLCLIYKNRPAVCRFDGAYKLYKDIIPFDEFYRLCIFYCNQYKKVRYSHERK